MGSNPVILALRFVLELAALAAYAYWGWTQHEGAWRFVWAIGLVIVAAAVWGIFRVPGEPKDAPIAVPGIVRLVIEVVIFGGAVWLLREANQPAAALAFGGLVALHYVASYDTVLRLLRK